MVKSSIKVSKSTVKLNSIWTFSTLHGNFRFVKVTVNEEHLQRTENLRRDFLDACIRWSNWKRKFTSWNVFSCESDVSFDCEVWMYVLCFWLDASLKHWINCKWEISLTFPSTLMEKQKCLLELRRQNQFVQRTRTLRQEIIFSLIFPLNDWTNKEHFCYLCIKLIWSLI